MTNTSVDKIWNAVKKIKRTTSFDNTQQNCNKEKNPDSEEGIRDTSWAALCAVQVLKIRRPRTDKIVTILQCFYLINGKVK